MGTTKESRKPLQVAVLSVSNRRSLGHDPSGELIKTALNRAGHVLVDHLVKFGTEQEMRELLEQLIDEPKIDALICNGGTGITDQMPEALEPLLDRKIPGFSMLFHSLSYEDIGSSGILSRAMAGIAKNTLVFLIPGSENGCKMAMEKIILPQLDSSTSPCNLAGLLARPSPK